MSLTLEEVKERLLKTFDPDDLLEALQITSEQLLERFEDKLINRLDVFEQELVFVLMQPNKKIRKGAKMTMSQWCDKEGLLWYTIDTLQELIDYVSNA